MIDSFTFGIALIALMIGFFDALAIHELQKDIKDLQEKKKE